MLWRPFARFPYFFQIAQKKHIKFTDVEEKSTNFKLTKCFLFQNQKKKSCCLVWLIVFWVRGSEEAQRESVQINSASIKWFGKERQLRHPHVSTYGYWRVTGLLCLHISEKNETNGSSKHTNKAGGTDQDLRKSFGKLSRPNHGFGEVGIDHMCNQTVRETIWMQFANNLDYKSKLRLS